MKSTLSKLLVVTFLAFSLSTVSSLASAKSFTSCTCVPAHCYCGQYYPAKKVCRTYHRHYRTTGGYCQCGVYYPRVRYYWWK